MEFCITATGAGAGAGTGAAGGAVGSLKEEALVSCGHVCGKCMEYRYLDPPRVSNFSPQVCFWWLRGTNFTPWEDSGTYIWLKFMVNVGQYSIHGAIGDVYVSDKICVKTSDSDTPPKVRCIKIEKT